MVSYLIFLFSSAKEALNVDIDEEEIQKTFKWMPTVLLLILGFVLTVLGANYAVESASSIARSFGVSEWVIGLLLIAFGTSLPELVVSVVAAKKGNAEMSIGNIIGSNVANFSMVLGGASIINPLKVDLNASAYDIYIMSAASITLLFILANKLYNKAGAIFLLIIFALFIQNSLT
jgi:cation:H+ antiporter